LRLVPITRDWMFEQAQKCVGFCADTSHPWGRCNFLKEMPRKYELSFAAYDAGELIAVAIVSQKSKEEWRLHLLVAAPGCRSQGVGTVFFKQLFAALRKKGGKLLTWKVADANSRDLSFYRQFGKEGEICNGHILMTRRLQRVVTIHQPNFMPWLPFFEKADAADVFVVLAQADYEKGGYQNRFRLNGAWYTMPASVKLGTPICDVTYCAPQSNWESLCRRLPDFASKLELFGDCVSSSLLGTNLCIIRKGFELLGVNSEIALDSATPLKRTERLVDIVKRFDGDVYLSGPSGSKYLNEDLFSSEGISVEYFKARTVKPLLECDLG